MVVGKGGAVANTALAWGGGKRCTLPNWKTAWGVDLRWGTNLVRGLHQERSLSETHIIFGRKVFEGVANKSSSKMCFDFKSGSLKKRHQSQGKRDRQLDCSFEGSNLSYRQNDSGFGEKEHRGKKKI